MELLMSDPFQNTKKKKRETGSYGSTSPVDKSVSACMLSRFSPVRLFVIPWTVARQAPLSMEFSRLEYWSGLPGPSPGDLPNSGMGPASLIPHWQAGSLPLAPPGKPIDESRGSQTQPHLRITLGSF